MATKFEVDEWVHRVANTRVSMFYPTIVSKQTGLPLENVFERLLDLSKIGQLIVKWEVICPNYSCHRKLFVMDSLGERLGEVLNCYYCGEEVEVTLDNIFPIFGISPEFRDTKKKQRNDSIQYSSNRFKHTSFIRKDINT